MRRPDGNGAPRLDGFGHAATPRLGTFAITASCPPGRRRADPRCTAIDTEPGGSLRIRDKAAANSTVFLAW